MICGVVYVKDDLQNCSNSSIKSGKDSVCLYYVRGKRRREGGKERERERERESLFPPPVISTKKRTYLSTYKVLQ